jgi:DNA-binding transcriptional LysR family regulator
MPVVQSFLGENPSVRAHVQLLDRVTNLVEEGIDIALRIGELPDSAQRATRVGRVTRVCVASPSYLAEHPAPDTPLDLVNHSLAVHNGRRRWRFQAGGHAIEPRVIVNNAPAVVELAQRGFGITQVLSYQVGEALADGSLLRVLKDFEPNSVPVHLVTPARRHTSVRTQAFIAYAAVRLREVAANGWRRDQNAR